MLSSSLDIDVKLGGTSYCQRPWSYGLFANLSRVTIIKHIQNTVQTYVKSVSVGTLKDGYVPNVPLPRVPQEQRASPELTAPKDRIQLPGYSILPGWIPTLPKLGSVLGFSQRLL